MGLPYAKSGFFLGKILVQNPTKMHILVSWNIDRCIKWSYSNTENQMYQILKQIKFLVFWTYWE